MSNFKYDVAVIGLGYVGLPLAIQATSSNLKVYGYDIDENKISNYNLGKSTIEDEVIIQLDKVNQKPLLHLLKEMGLTDLEIYQNLHYSDFFYFTKPLSEFLKFMLEKVKLSLKVQ